MFPFRFLCLLAFSLLLNGYFCEDYSGIVDGSVENDWIPFLVSINFNNSDELGLMGGGIAINEHYVITAGHLFNDFPEELLPNLTIGYGSNNRNNQIHASVEGVITYLNMTKRTDDFAIVRVKDFDWDRVANATEYRLNITISDIRSRQTVTLVGWGAEKDEFGEPQDDLQVTTLEENPYGECVREMLTPEYRLRHPAIEIRENSSFCLHSKHSSPCYGDSGSPVFTITNGQFNFYGVVSWGSSSCSDGESTVFTRAFYYRDAIENITGFNRFVDA